MSAEPGEEPAYITGHKDDDGETIIIAKQGAIESVSGATPLDRAEFRVRPDGTVMRYLVDGHL
ncbi:MAG: hypothetical protein ACRDOI_17045 [Trebonia sp.]